MKNLISALLLCSALQLSSLAQVPGQPFRGVPMLQSHNEPAEELPKFDIDFPGGSPAALVELIQVGLDSLGEKHYINVIIPEEFKSEKLPPLKMRNVDVQELFQALQLASLRNIAYSSGSISYGDGGVGRPRMQAGTTRYGFQTTGPVTPRSIWYFNVEKPAQVETLKMVRYFQLAPYLTEFTMDDIGSAIEAGWNMLGEKDTPKLNFHQDTKLLIAVGAPQHLELINSMLKELGAGMTNRPVLKADDSSQKRKPQPQPQSIGTPN